MWLNLHSLCFFSFQFSSCGCVSEFGVCALISLNDINVESILFSCDTFCLDVSANWNSLLKQLLTERRAAWGIISSRQFTRHHRPSANAEARSNRHERKHFFFWDADTNKDLVLALTLCNLFVSSFWFLSQVASCCTKQLAQCVDFTFNTVPLKS